MKIRRFEDLECWKEARALMKIIYEITKKIHFSKDYRLRDQFIGAGISIMNNVAEGFDSQFNNEFMRFLKISRRSISEVENCLYIAIDQNYITQKEFVDTFNQAEKERQLVDGMLRYLRKFKRTQRE